MKFRTPPQVSSLNDLVQGLDDLNSMLDEMIYEVNIANLKLSNMHILKKNNESSKISIPQ